MYNQLKSIILPLLKVEETQPHPPSGYDPHEFMRVERADASYLAYRLFFWKLYAVAWAIGVLVAAVALVMVETWYLVFVFPLLIIAAIKAAILYVTSRLDYEMRWYVITDRSLLIREGVWDVREITLTFANAQNVRVTQGPLQRYFGFSNVEIDTAGGGGKQEEKGMTRHRAVLRGLAKPAEVRDMILELLRRHRTAGLGDPDDPEQHGVPFNPLLVQEIWEEAKGVRRVMEVASKAAGS
jgi:uncharacterized membrane protein YdbT with pleckstrin-like domain